jgi:hypothetical protein
MKNLGFNFGRMSNEDKMLLLIVGIGAFFLAPKIAGAMAQKTGEVIGETAGNVIIDSASGAVIGVGKAVGIPETSMDKCQAAIAAGNMWEASFQCPAPTYLKALWHSTFG